MLRKYRKKWRKKCPNRQKSGCFDGHITKNDYPGLKMIIDRTNNQ
jgi:hypothetical protein